VCHTSYNQLLGKELLHIVKTRECSISAFVFSVLLTLSHTHLFENKVISFLTTYAHNCFRSVARASKSLWLRSLYTKHDLLYNDMEEVVLQTCKNSQYGWDHIVRSLVSLGIRFLDVTLNLADVHEMHMFGEKELSRVSDNTRFYREVVRARARAKERRSDDEKHQHNEDYTANNNTQVVAHTHTSSPLSMVLLGVKMLRETFKLHPMVRKDILEKLLLRMITKVNSGVPAIYLLEV